MGKNKAYVLDTSALFCLKDDEEGAARVEKILDDARNNRCQALVSFMSLMEYLYVTLMRYGEDLARKAYLELTLLPIKIVESNEELGLVAAEFKANHSLSVADAWIAATAKLFTATLVHKDPEFKAIHRSVNCLALPYKS